jgi:hypothetical protein
MANAVDAPNVTSCAPRVTARVIPLGATTTYYYRTSGGTRGSTTDASAIPAGAIVERIA